MAFPNDRGYNLEREMEFAYEMIHRMHSEFDRLLSKLMGKGVLTHDDEFDILYDPDDAPE